MSDIKITRLRHGGGNGGQNKNKVETAVRIEHVPTGIVVTACNERTQQANLKEATRRLRGRLVALRSEREAAERYERHKSAAWAGFGSDKRIRSYVFHRRNIAIDHRTGLQMPVGQAMNGDIDEFINASINAMMSEGDER